MFSLSLSHTHTHAIAGPDKKKRQREDFNTAQLKRYLFQRHREIERERD